MKKYYSLVLLVPLALAVNARTLTPEEALARINNGMAKAPARTTATKTVSPAYTMRQGGFTSLYVFDSAKDGYLVVSADDCAMPLLGYSDTGKFDADNIPPQMQWWLDFYAREIKAASSDAVSMGRASVVRKADEEKTPIQPMLTTLWNQNAPYNDDCPMDNGQRSVTGCVATAMAQAMKYHNWPEKGTGSNSYSWNGQTLSLDFSSITFDWANMTDTYDSSSTSAQNAAVAQLMYACGVSVDMDYTSDESGASSMNIAPALYKYFGYSGAMAQPQRPFYGTADWENLVYDQLAQGIPVLYGGQSNEGGHQFVCDGYSSDGYFHFNWGWAGESDGYFLLSALDPMSQGIGGSTTGFNYDQSIVINMVPSTRTDIKAIPLIYCYGDFETESSSATLGQSVTFGSSDAFFNFGCTTAIGIFGVKIVGSDGKVQYAQGSETSLPAIEGISGFSVTLPSGLGNGAYTVTPVFKASGSDEWSDVLAPLSGVQALSMSVEDGQASFTEAEGAKLEVSDFAFSSNVYLGTNFKATFTLKNDGTQEYYGQLMFALIDSNGNMVDESSSALAVDLTAGESSAQTYISSFASETETESGTTQTVEPGTYYLLIFDSTTNNIVYEYPDAVEVQSAPTNTTLSVTSFGLANGETEVTNISDVRFTGTVECTEGYYANQLKVAVFPEGAETTSIEGSTDFLFLDAGQSSSFSASADLGAATSNSEYFAVVFDANNNQLSDPVYFSIGNLSAVANVVAEDNSDVHFYNLQGEEISADALQTGIYIRQQGQSITKVMIK